VAEIRSGRGEGSWPAGVGGGRGGSMAGVGRHSWFEWIRALENKPIALRRSGAQGELTYGKE